ncbi:hypothetical protein FOBRF1_007968 [Fusarium oxysporum]
MTAAKPKLVLQEKAWARQWVWPGGSFGVTEVTFGYCATGSDCQFMTRFTPLSAGKETFRQFFQKQLGAGIFLADIDWMDTCTNDVSVFIPF